MATSTIVSTKRALVDHLQGRPALNGVQVTYADPGDRARAEQVWLGEVRTAEQEPVSLRSGRKQRNESYELDVICDALKATAETAEARCLELVAELEELLAAATLDAPGVLWATVTDMRLKTAETANGPLARAVVTVTVRARLTP